jgi:hypothetical protein
LISRLHQSKTGTEVFRYRDSKKYSNFFEEFASKGIEITPLVMVKIVSVPFPTPTTISRVESNPLRLVGGGSPVAQGTPKASSDPQHQRLSDALGLGLRRNEITDDLVLLGFASSATVEPTWRRTTSTRIRARVAAAELVLGGVSKPTLPQIANCIQRSSRTLIDRFKIRDALFAFPPPELAPVLVDVWVKALTIDEFSAGLESAFGLLDSNPVAVRLLRGLAAVHRQNAAFSAGDGYFSAALRNELSTRGLGSTGVLRWTGFVTDALRDSLFLWSESTQNLVSVVPRIVSDLRPILLPSACEALSTVAGRSTVFEVS